MWAQVQAPSIASLMALKKQQQMSQILGTSQWGDLDETLAFGLAQPWLL